MRRLFLATAVICMSCLLQSCKKDTEPMSVVPVKVKLYTVSMEHASGMHSFSGTVEEESGSSLSFATAGTVQKIYVSAGQMVRKGSPIASVDPISVRNAYEATLATRRQAEDAYRRMKQLHDAGSLPEMQWIEVGSKLKQAVSAERIAKKGLSDCNLYAPFSGYVADKLVEVGQNVAPGVPVAKLVRIDRVKVKLSVPEDEIAPVRTGQTVAVSVPALDGRHFMGRIVEKGVEANPLSHSYDVKVIVDNASHQLLPGMVCEAELRVRDVKPAAIMLPATVIQIDTDNREFVWTATGGKAKRTYVSIGGSVGDKIVVESGLSIGDKVIVSGQQKVSEGTKIKD